MSRYYVINGAKIPSVTTIIDKTTDKSGLEAWKRITPNWEDITKTAANYGTLIHWRILNRIGGNGLRLPEIPITDWPIDIRKMADVGWKQFREWWVKEHAEPVFVEYRVVRWGKRPYAGTLDLLAKKRLASGGERYIICDIKTTKKHRHEHEIQIAAYARALRTQDRIRCDSGNLIYVAGNRSEAEVVTMDREDMREAEKEWLEMLSEFYAKEISRCRKKNAQVIE